MSALLQRLIEHGVPADLIADVAMLIATANTAQGIIEARKQKDRDRKASKKHFPRNSVEGAEKESAPPNEIYLTPPAKKNNPLPPEFDFQSVWNEMAAQSGLSLCQAMSRGRKAKVRQRIIESGEAALRQAIAAVGQSEFCRGGNDRGWRAGPDFVLQETSFTKLLEGQYTTIKTGGNVLDERQAFLARKYGS